MPDSISLREFDQNRRRGQWQHITLKPFGTTRKSHPSVRQWAKTKKVDMDALPILYPRGGLERKAVAEVIKEKRKRASEVPFENI